jgi:hypothetical protein
MKNYTIGADASGQPAITYGMNQWTGGGGFGDFLKDAGKIAALYYGGSAALEAMGAGATLPEAINMGTGMVSAETAAAAAPAVGGTGLTGAALSAELPVGSQYVAPNVTELGQVASNTPELPSGTPLAEVGQTTPEMTAQQTSDAINAEQIASTPASTIGEQITAEQAAAAEAAKNAAIAGGGATALKDILPYTAGAGIVSSLIGADAAKTAAQTQTDAAAKAVGQQQVNLDLINKQLTPYRAGGTQALNTLGSMGTGTYGMYDAAGNLTGTGTGSGYLQHQFNAADLKAGLAPNYDFMLQQGQMANQRAANMGGGAIGGNALQGLNKYTQDYAGNAYQNAFTNYQSQRTNIYNTLAGIAGLGMQGQNAANIAMTNATNATTQLGVGSAAAQAAGQVGQANAYGNTIGNIGNQYMLAALLNQKGSVV